MQRVKGSTKYDTIRRYLEHIYLYGFFSREDWEELGREKDYDKMLSLIREVYPEIDENAVWKDRKKYLRFLRQYADSLEQRLIKTYSLYGLDEEEMLDLLRIFIFLQKGPCTVQDLACHLEVNSTNQDRAFDALSRRRLRELEEYGFVIKQKKSSSGRASETCYALATDVLRDLSETELEALYAFVCFAGGITYPRVPADYLKHSLERRVSSVPQSAPVLLRHHGKRGVFDEDIVYAVLQAIHARRKLSLRVDGELLPHELIPVAIRVDQRLGRWYLLAFADKPVIYRISRLSHVVEKETVVHEEWCVAEDAVLNAFGTVGFSGKDLEEEPTLVEVELHFQKRPELLAQFRRELRLGQILEEDGCLVYRVLIRDPGELMPFLRSYAPWIHIRPGTHELDKRLRLDLQAMKERLEDGFSS